MINSRVIPISTLRHKSAHCTHKTKGPYTWAYNYRGCNIEFARGFQGQLVTVFLTGPISNTLQ